MISIPFNNLLQYYNCVVLAIKGALCKATDYELLRMIFVLYIVCVTYF